MAKQEPGYWPSDFNPGNFWAGNFWPIYGQVIQAFVKNVWLDSTITKNLYFKSTVTKNYWIDSDFE